MFHRMHESTGLATQDPSSSLAKEAERFSALTFLSQDDVHKPKGNLLLFGEAEDLLTTTGTSVTAGYLTTLVEYLAEPSSQESV